MKDNHKYPQIVYSSGNGFFVVASQPVLSIAGNPNFKQLLYKVIQRDKKKLMWNIISTARG